MISARSAGGIFFHRFFAPAPAAAFPPRRPSSTAARSLRRPMARMVAH